jgi:transposase
MTQARGLQAVRPRRFDALYARRQQRDVTMAEAAEMLGVTARTFRHWRGRYDAEGVEGLQDRRIGRASGRAVPVDAALRRMRVYETRYTG